MSKRAYTYIIGIALVLTALTAVALHKPQEAMQHTSKASAVSTTKITIQSYMFNPMAITVKAGSTVTWTNQDSVKHNVVADAASADAPNGPLIGKGESYSFTFKKPGTYTFHCMPHPTMHGSVIVTN